LLLKDTIVIDIIFSIIKLSLEESSRVLEGTPAYHPKAIEEIPRSQQYRMSLDTVLENQDLAPTEEGEPCAAIVGPSTPSSQDDSIDATEETWEIEARVDEYLATEQLET
jgi:hypothetical protein